MVYRWNSRNKVRFYLMMMMLIVPKVDSHSLLRHESENEDTITMMMMTTTAGSRRLDNSSQSSTPTPIPSYVTTPFEAPTAKPSAYPTAIPTRPTSFPTVPPAAIPTVPAPTIMTVNGDDVESEKAVIFDGNLRSSGTRVFGVGIGVFLLSTGFVLLVPICLLLYSHPRCADSRCFQRPINTVYWFLFWYTILVLCVALPQREPSPLSDEDGPTKTNKYYRARYGVGIPYAIIVVYIISDYLKNYGEQEVVLTGDEPVHGLNIDSESLGVRFMSSRVPAIERSNL